MRIDSGDVKSLQRWILTSLTAVIVFFLKRGVDKFDSIEQNVLAISKDVVMLKVKICAIQKFKTEIQEVESD